MTQANHPTHRSAVDIHAHYFPQTFLDLIAANAGACGLEHRMIEGKGPQFKIGHLTTGPVGRKFVDLDTRLAAMDGQSVAVHLLSLSQPMVYWAKRDLAQRLTEAYNDALVAAHEGYPSGSTGLRPCRCMNRIWPCARWSAPRSSPV
jgi:aminocarboxymuconate-semialdehyde decarboxylase